MTKAVLAVLPLIALFMVASFDASAQSRKCPKGFVYDAETGKCVGRRGSH